MLLESLNVKKEVNGMEMKYSYGIIESKYLENVVYGIYVSREYIDGEKVIDLYEDSIKYVSPIKEKVIGLRDLLYKGEVSPLHLIDIVGDFVDNCVNDFIALEKIAG